MYVNINVGTSWGGTFLQISFFYFIETDSSFLHFRVVRGARGGVRGLKGSFTIFLFSVRTHILDSNEVWYS